MTTNKTIFVKDRNVCRTCQGQLQYIGPQMFMVPDCMADEMGCPKCDETVYYALPPPQPNTITIGGKVED